MNLTGIHEDVCGFNPWPCPVGQGSGIAISYGIDCKSGSDPKLLRCRLATVAPIPPLAWELPYAAGVALKKKKKKGNSIIQSEQATWFNRKQNVVIITKY